MLGRRVPHPPSTHFSDVDGLPIAKRMKTEESVDTDEISSRDESDCQSVTNVPRAFRNEIPDSEDEGFSDEDDAGQLDHRPTELESALPPVRTDKDAIADYEAMRAAEDHSCTGLVERLSSRSWTKGRSSIYVDAFNLALETVLEDEAHLFDESETEIFNQWKSLDYETQYIYVRLFLRKTSAWHRLSRLRYYGDVSDLPLAIKNLQSRRPLPESTGEQQVNPGELSPPEHLAFGSSFIFADDSAAEITTLDEASSLLNLEELKMLAKEAKVQGKNKGELLKALSRMSQSQSGLEWSLLKRSDSTQSTTSVDYAALNNRILGTSELDEKPVKDIDDNVVQNLQDKNRNQHFVDKILDSTGRCVRLSLPALKLFERVHLVFYRSTEWTDKSLTTIILARISRLNFPQYIVSRSANIFESRPALLEFEAALRTQYRVDNILEFNGTPKDDGLQEILSIFEEVHSRWKILVDEEQRKEDRVYETGEGAYLRRFSPAHVYTRIIHKATAVLGKRKMHDREHQVLTELLNQCLFHAARRGSWYQRKALLEEHYMADLRPVHRIVSLDQQKRHWRRISLKTCEEGLQDRECHVIYHYDLQKRIRKLEKGLKLAKREQHDFGHVSLSKPAERSVEGIQIIKKVVWQVTESIEKAQTPASIFCIWTSVHHSTRPSCEEYCISSLSHVLICQVPSGRSTPEERAKSTKTIWVDKREGGGECSVEAMCLSYYRDQGYRGYHCEGGIMRTLFGYLFYDVLFVYVPNVFQTAYQTCPLDLHTDSFYPSRASEINRRLVEISNGEAGRLISEVDDREREKKTCIVGLKWDFAVEDLLEIASCFEGPALATICKVMAQEYRARGGGMPDLFLWNPARKEVMFSEVKSENDRLSDTQRLWIHVLTGAGIKVELCNAVARKIESRGE